ncbi:MAG: DinB family protein [Nocardioidaceae bacterium]
MSPPNEPTIMWPPAAGTEIETLIGSLERQRRTFAWKCGDLDAAGLRATTAATTMTLGGLLKHLALVEADYFCLKLVGRSPGPPWDTVDWESEPDWEWRTAAEDTPEQLYGLWEESVTRSRANLTEALAEDDLGRSAQVTWPDGQSPSIRRLLVDMIEEYARHTGHADLLREAVDGLVGEDPPQT